MTNVRQLPVRQQSAPEASSTYRDRVEYSAFGDALEDALRCSSDLLDQLDTALIADPADVRFLAERVAGLIRASLDVLEQTVVDSEIAP